MTQSTQEAFEIWCHENDHMCTAKEYGAPYDDPHTQSAWEVWQAATEAAKATNVVAGELPPLPKTQYYGMKGQLIYWDKQRMLEYGQTCAEAARKPTAALSPTPTSDAPQAKGSEVSK